MPTTVQAALLGVVQGLTEFLPVSSSAHLILARTFFGFDADKFGLPFDVACHVGTLIAVLISRREWPRWSRRCRTCSTPGASAPDPRARGRFDARLIRPSWPGHDPGGRRRAAVSSGGVIEAAISVIRNGGRHAHWARRACARRRATTRQRADVIGRRGPRDRLPGAALVPGVSRSGIIVSGWRGPPIGVRQRGFCLTPGDSGDARRSRRSARGPHLLSAGRGAEAETPSAWAFSPRRSSLRPVLVSSSAPRSPVCWYPGRPGPRAGCGRRGDLVR